MPNSEVKRLRAELEEATSDQSGEAVVRRPIRFEGTLKDGRKIDSELHHMTSTEDSGGWWYAFELVDGPIFFSHDFASWNVSA